MRMLRRIFWNKITGSIVAVIVILALILALVADGYDIILPDWTSEAITNIASILTIIALVIAFTQTKDLKIISGSLSTRYLGVFPEYMSDLVDLIERTEKSIVILCDIPAYGVFTAGNTFRKYKRQIEMKLDEDAIDVQLIW